MVYFRSYFLVFSLLVLKKKQEPIYVLPENDSYTKSRQKGVGYTSLTPLSKPFPFLYKNRVVNLDHIGPWFLDI